LGEAISRAERFAELGADILFVEAPKSEAEMREICSSLPKPNMANIVEGGETPDLPPDMLADLGYRIAAYPLSLMAAAMKAMVETLGTMAAGQPRTAHLMEFGELRRRIGFDAYYEASERYASARRSE
ncbi:MAG: isocitrate lyase/phosphoenolpyruvate mutase family protein, partial [Pseudomonadota bacterium]